MNYCTKEFRINFQADIARELITPQTLNNWKIRDVPYKYVKK